MERLTLVIDGMSCGHCVNAVSGALQQLAGVNVEQVTIGQATVSYDPARTSVEQMIDAVGDEGYTAHRAAAA